MKKLLTLLAILFVATTTAFAQGSIKGTVKDATNGETIIGATVTYAPGKGGTTDIDGNFAIDVPNGTYNVAIQFSGYKTENREVKVDGAAVFINIQLQPNVIKEVEVFADMAISRTTPVAFSNIPAEKIKEQGGGQDLPMILNTTPGIYATQGGGGDGDARISIRGFNQRNVAVMVDGIPMNDMENGLVFWSNWFGLDNITKTMQVQRGLGASKLAVPSVGGTINIITSGFDSKRALTFKQEYGNNLALRTLLSYTSGELKGGWAVTAATSYKRNDGYVDGTWSRMWFYFLKVDKRVGNHVFSLSGFGAPQQHGQRSFRQPIARYNHELARDLGWSEGKLDTVPELGIRYNQNWGTVSEERDNVYGGVMSERINFFHKPVISLRHSWAPNDKFYLSNTVYASFANGGGTALQATPNVNANGTYDMQQIITNNQTNPFNQYVYQGDTVQLASNFLRASMNNHQWYGLLSTFNYKPKEGWTISGGVDLRTYKSEKYRRVFDFMGGDVISPALSSANENEPGFIVDDTNDKITYNFGGLVNYGGLFGLAEYKGGNWSAFVNASGVVTSYQRIDYFLKKDTATGEFQKSPVRVFPGYTFKGGANYNLTEKSSIYGNTGYFSRAPRFSNVFINTTGKGNDESVNAVNENVIAGELGYTFTSPKFSANVNAYYTVWRNRPLDFAQTITIDGENYAYNINGMNARHMGIEFDAAYKPRKNLTIEGMFSLGDWIWTSTDTVRVTDDFGNIITKKFFDAKGVKVGDAAQITAAGSIRYEPIKRLYIKGQFTYFSKNYSDFDPTTLSGVNAGRQSWRMPDYGLLDIHLGYGFKVNKKVQFDIRGSVFNVLNAVYITDATNNGFTTFGQNFDATSASVFVGMGRRFNTSLTITY